MPVVQLKYSKKSGFIGVSVLLIAFLLLLRTCAVNYYAHDIVGAVVFGAFGIVVAVVMGIMINGRLLPALRGDIAFELDEQGMKDFIRGITIDWKDVEDIYLQPARTSSMLVFELKFDSDFGKRIHVLLRWVEGRDWEIYNRVVAYFDEIEGITREED
jgi:hypothetical protein